MTPQETHTRLQALALEYVGAFAIMQAAVDRIAQTAILHNVGPISPQVAALLVRRVGSRFNDDDRQRLVVALAGDTGQKGPDLSMWKRLCFQRDLIAHRPSVVGDRGGEPVLIASRLDNKGRVEQFSASESELARDIADVLALTAHVGMMGEGHFYTTITAGWDIGWNVLEGEEGSDADPSAPSG